MQTLRTLVLAATLVAGTLGTPARAASGDPLLVNLSSDDKHRVEMGIGFGVKQLELGHPLTIFLNDRSVQLASSEYAPKFRKQQKLLAAAIDRGATVLVCPGCMEHFGVKEADLLPGVKPSSPAVVEAVLFKPNTRTMSW